MRHISVQTSQTLVVLSNKFLIIQASFQTGKNVEETFVVFCFPFMDGGVKLFLLAVVFLEELSVFC